MTALVPHAYLQGREVYDDDDDPDDNELDGSQAAEDVEDSDSA
jgi:hypothetical protein